MNTVAPGADTLAFGFTTHDPIDWTLTGLSWLRPTETSGVGDASVPVDLDTTGLAPGTYTGMLTIDAPATVDGGATVQATVYTHADVRVGGMSVLGSDPANYNWDPGIATDGVGTLAVWGSQSGSTPTLQAARLDGAGEAVTVAPIVSGWPWKERTAIAFDGQNHLVVWLEEDAQTSNGRRTGTVYVKALRVAANGQPIDSIPIVVMERPYSRTHQVWPLRVAFDGSAYTVLWGDVSPGPSLAHVRRVGIDGSLRGTARRIYPTPGTSNPQFTLPAIQCAPVAGTCLVVWLERDGETDAVGKYIDKIYGVRLSGDRVLDAVPRRLLSDAGYELVLGSDGASGYLVAVARTLVCPGPVLCGRDVVAARITADGTSLDPDGIRLTQGPSAGAVADARVTSVVFDGANWLALWYHNEAVTGLHWHGVHVAPDGTVLDSEHEGLMLDPSPLALSAVLAPTRAHVQMVGLDLAAWTDTTLTPVAQRVLPRAPLPVLPERAIGAIGPQTVGERSLLTFVVTAPSLGPQAAFTATNLPAGAVLDAGTAVFRWMPGPDQAGIYPGVGFMASDGTRTVSETVTMTVTEARLTLGGTVSLTDGTPVPGAAVRTRTANGKRTTFSDGDGRYRFTDLTPRAFTVRLDKPTKKLYRAAPRAGYATLAGSDRLDLDLVLTPK